MLGSDNLANKVTYIRLWEVFEFPWGTAIRERRTGKWHKLFLKPDGQEINVENLAIVIHDNGIEFL